MLNFGGGVHSPKRMVFQREEPKAWIFSSGQWWEPQQCHPQCQSEQWSDGCWSCCIVSRVSFSFKVGDIQTVPFFLDFERTWPIGIGSYQPIIPFTRQRCCFKKYKLTHFTISSPGHVRAPFNLHHLVIPERTWNTRTLARDYRLEKTQNSKPPT